LIIDGKPLIGVAGYGGEVGHMPVRVDGRACRCGSSGCWETEVGEEALLRHAHYPLDAGRAGVEQVLGRATEGAEPEQSALEQVGRWIGFGLAGLINVFNPRLVVLGGHLGRVFQLVAPIVEAELERRALPASRALVRIVPAALAGDALLLGAAELALEPLFANPGAYTKLSSGREGVHACI
jgi:predicted NBD/HSP70 family sugar kinase